VKPSTDLSAPLIHRCGVHRREWWGPGAAVAKAAPEEELNAGLPSSTRVAIENWAKQQKDRPSRSLLAGSRCYALLLLEPLVVGLGPNVYNIMHRYTRHGMWPMRTNIEIDDVLMREAQKASGHATKKQTVEEALRLMIRLRRQHEVDAAFDRYRWRGNLARSRTGRGAR